MKAMKEILKAAGIVYTLVIVSGIVAGMSMMLGSEKPNPETLDKNLKGASSIKLEFNKCYAKTGISLHDVEFKDFGKIGPAASYMMVHATLFQSQIHTDHDLGQFSQTKLLPVECGKLQPEFELTAQQAHTLLKQERDAFIEKTMPKLKNAHKGLFFMEPAIQFK